MSATPELTTRDVLQQIDRRLSRIEDLQLRHEERNDQAHASFDARIDYARTELETRMQSGHARLETKMEAGHARMDAKMEACHTRLDAKIDRNLRWTVGLIVGSWMTTMSAILLK